MAFWNTDKVNHRERFFKEPFDQTDLKLKEAPTCFWVLSITDRFPSVGTQVSLIRAPWEEEGLQTFLTITHSRAFSDFVTL